MFTGDFLSVTSTGLDQYTPTSSSSMRQEKDIFVIFIHALQNGLFRIHMEGQTGRQVIHTTVHLYRNEEMTRTLSKDCELKFYQEYYT